MPTTEPRPPLEGLRVVAVEQYGAGPFGSQYLADLGAEVIKVENRADGGDVARSVGPHFLGGARDRDDSSLFFQGFNRGKKSLTLDLKHPTGREVLLRLLAGADALCHNLRGDVPGKLGLTFGDLEATNPRLVCAHLTGYGREGSRARWPGYDYLMQAECGYFAITGEPDGPPTRMGLSIVDMMAGLAMAFGLVSAVLAARASGRGRDVDVTLFDTALYNLNYLGHFALNAGTRPGKQPRSAHPMLVPCQLYRTGDGWIYLMCNKEKFWSRLCRLIGRPEWSEDPRFRSFPDRLRHRDLLTLLLDEALQAATTAVWMGRFGGEIPAAPVLEVADALANPFVAERGGIEELCDPAGTPFSLLAQPVRAGSRPAPASAPALGADTARLLAELGYDAATIQALADDGVI